MGGYLEQQFNKIESEIIKEIRISGLMFTIEFNSKIALDFAKDLIEEGFIFSVKSGNILNFSPSLIIDKKDCDIFIEALVKVLKKYS